MRFRTFSKISIFLLASSLSLSVLAAGWKSGTITQLGTSTTGANTYGGCFIYFTPDGYTSNNVGMAECNGNNNVYYVSMDCEATSAATTGLTKARANASYSAAQLAFVTNKAISIYVEDAQVDGFCVASKTSIVQ